MASGTGLNPVVSLLLQRIGIGLVLLLAISALLFIGVELLPGDFAQKPSAGSRLTSSGMPA